MPPIIKLNVGGRIFSTRTTTLAEAKWFEPYLEGRWPWPLDTNGAYFVDADPDLWEHLLRFMRRPNVYPLFWDTAKGFDYDLYNRLEREAFDFRVGKLGDWIKEKQYLKAVTVRAHPPVARELDDVDPEYYTMNEDYERHVVPRVRKVYVCPRGIAVHRGHPEKCGQACAKAQGGTPAEYEEEPYWEVVTIRKSTVFDEKVCREPETYGCAG
ncbi:hypothetical protein BU26DRAFT_483471 [Trematosphaeria pertusa]|uniref:Potassium channel tetramerisation-type BTB domain-containing protein n=1 Tax=Trematosphaeria pertusa TaxID=390896 RepID=A0A6A6IDU6_9PLEO|nr:uncharacterized protein BU26DRAFT_483471 [Trematosphaeria pertusa]KAF2248606.1 hypothetical protein BU26DRAFT_483471 [Trematosphaeria pertusa]